MTSFSNWSRYPWPRNHN